MFDRHFTSILSNPNDCLTKAAKESKSSFPTFTFDGTNINRLTLNYKEEGGEFILSLYGKIGVSGASGRRILNQMISDMKKQSLIKDAVLINQQTIKQNSIIFTVDITI